MSILPIAYLLFVINFLFGVLVAVGIIPRGRWGKVHHFLYLLTMAGIVAAAIEAVAQQRSLLMIAAMTLLLLGMSRTRGGGRAHSIYASVCLVVYSVVVYSVMAGPVGAGL